MIESNAFYKKFIRDLSPTLVVMVVAFILLIGFNIRSELSRLVADGQLLNHSGVNAVSMETEKAIDHLISLASREPILKTALREQTPANINIIKQVTFASLLARNPEYDQIRWIDLEGRELIRVHRDNTNTIVTVPDNKLQSKAQHTYFIEGSKLAEQQIYISEMELNREHGIVEVPYKPVLRLVTLLTDHAGEKIGLLVLNINATGLLDRFEQNTSEFASLKLIDAAGYELHTQGSDPYGGFFRREASDFVAKHPETWRLMKSGVDNGEYADREGLGIWEKVPFVNDTTIDVVNPTFYIATQLDNGAIASVQKNVVGKSLLFMLLPLILLARFSWRRCQQEVNHIENLNFTEQLYNSAPCGYHSCSADGTFININDTELNWLEYERDELIGKADISKVLTDESYQTLKSRQQDLIDRGVLRDLQLELKRRNGITMPVLYNSVAKYDSKGDFSHSITTIIDNRDAIERERSRADQALFLISITNNLPGMIGYWDIFLENRIVNHHFDKWLKSNGKDEHSPDIKELLGDNVHGHVEAGLAAEKDGEPYKIERKLIGSDGQATDVIVHFVPCRIDGELEGYLVVAIDITELKTAQSKLEDLNQALTRESDKASLANEAKSIFLANMSHEIRTPLNALLGISYLLEQSNLDQEQRENVAKIQFAGKSLLSIVNDILDLSKIEAGEMHIETIPFNLSALLSDIEAMLGNQAEIKGLEFRVEQDIPQESSCIQGDSHKLRQIIVNLLSNAIKFTDKGSVTLNATTAISDDQRICLRLTVRDTGIGISDKAREKLFQPFSQADVSTTRRFGGTGLGLTITKKMIDMMEGDIQVESVEGEGSAFSIEVNFDQVSDTEFTALASNDLHRNLRVLLAEDDFIQSRTLCNMSSRLGWSVETVHAGSDLINRVVDEYHSETPYDCLVLDWQLDDLDAYQSLQEIADQIGPNNVPKTILISAYDVEQLKKSPQAEMIFGFISKPVNASELFNKVSAAVALNKEGLSQFMPPVQEEDVLKDGELLLEGLHILLVDDSDLNLDVASKILGLDGATVTMRHNGQEALDAIGEHPDRYDLVLMDIQMPVMDGLTAVKHIREDKNLRLPVIALTAGALSEERQKALAAGMNDFVSKPFDPKGLVRCVRKHTRSTPNRQSEPTINEGRLPETTGQEHPVATKSVFDHEQALERIAGDQGMFASMVENVLNEYQAFECMANDTDSLVMSTDLARQMHKLAGNAGLVGAMQVNAAAAQIEYALKEDASVNLMPMLAELASCLKSLRLASENYFSNLSQPGSDQAARDNSIAPETINALIAELNNKNIQAYHHFNQHRQAILNAAGEERFDIIEQAIKQLNFNVAAQELSKLVVSEEYAA